MKKLLLFSIFSMVGIGLFGTPGAGHAMSKQCEHEPVTRPIYFFNVKADGSVEPQVVGYTVTYEETLCIEYFD